MSANTFQFQASLCAANAIFWMALTLTKLLHKPGHQRVYPAKCGLQLMASAASVLPMLLDSDFGVLIASVVINALTVAGIFALNFWIDGEIALESTVAHPVRRIPKTKLRQLMRSSLGL